MRQSELNIVVRSTEIDINGHVNNAKYLEYLEWGREEWFEKSGLSYELLLTDAGVQSVTVNINITYRRECRQGEELMVRTSPHKAGRSSFVFQQEITDLNGVVRAEATVTCVTIDAIKRASREMPDMLRTALENVLHPSSSGEN